MEKSDLSPEADRGQRTSGSCSRQPSTRTWFPRTGQAHLTATPCAPGCSATASASTARPLSSTPLSHLLRASYAAVGVTPAGPKETQVGWMRSPHGPPQTHENAEDRRFDLVATPAEARPGDILVSPGAQPHHHGRPEHRGRRAARDPGRVYVQDRRGGRNTLSARRRAAALSDPAIPHPDQTIQDQLPSHKRASEAAFEFEPSEWEQQFLIARNRRLAAFHQNTRRPQIAR